MQLRIIIITLILSTIVVSVTVAVSNESMQPTWNVSAEALLKAARNALGGEAKLAAVKSLVLKGEERGRNEWFGQVPSAKQEWLITSLEIYVLFPDHFFRVRGAMLGGNPRRYGFSGTDPVPIPEAGKRPSPTWPQTLNSLRADFGRLMLIMLLRTNGAATAILRPDAGSESTLEFSGLGPFPVYLELDKKTLLPSGLRYQIEMRTASGTTGEISSQLMNVDDWREINGIRLPHHLTISRDNKVDTDIRFQSIQIK